VDLLALFVSSRSVTRLGQSAAAEPDRTIDEHLRSRRSPLSREE